MYSDPTSVRRPAEDRLGTSSVRSSPGFHGRQGIIRRQYQDDVKQSNVFHAVDHHGAKASKVHTGVLKSSKNSATNTSDGRKIGLKNEAHTSKTVSFTNVEGISATQSGLAKKPELLSASAPAPASGEKSHNMAGKLTIALFLQKLGLSKYIISFQAEEVDMFALAHMNDDDLKSMGLPMGPRKKIVYALASLKAKKRETKT
ncbi:uncharacterized protein M6B38_338530 [Iris pallida]|uniref:SAM domain-containing protein n=1 Tax=Iris pallida TaxID=29817 RepID=A0AAX6DJM0_IRIPA|nr:Uncharacterized protein M6B38_242590 [Iris pallida]KAJ6833729.1 uncharacterized protein M6B38_338530 [Iris pallida]